MNLKTKEYYRCPPPTASLALNNLQYTMTLLYLLHQLKIKAAVVSRTSVHNFAYMMEINKYFPNSDTKSKLEINNE